ncbi:hypothetical protein CC77DRAFT_1022630 [Alternaria alternata]|uniref:Uncharacterized protein n=1 Tax=Alternaria alternata TaxID=5599 RepID=A0A177DEQ2_ALTAL|nr:hypothetical protein CC77DRAFT_1022630 [Alternaria alternata]OAG17731.1 hypothetical protein CC77DRAFT_1022630 [Alternaria alternata]
MSPRQPYLLPACLLRPIGNILAIHDTRIVCSQARAASPFARSGYHEDVLHGLKPSSHQYSGAARLVQSKHGRHRVRLDRGPDSRKVRSCKS